METGTNELVSMNANVVETHALVYTTRVLECILVNLRDSTGCTGIGTDCPAVLLIHTALSHLKTTDMKKMSEQLGLGNLDIKPCQGCALMPQSLP